MSIKITRFGSREALKETLVTRLEVELAAARASGRLVGLMLAGGSTPIPAYLEVARRNPPQVPNLRILFSDDRYVPSDAPDSNYHQSAPLLRAMAMPEAAVLRVRTELPLEAAAQDYERQLAGLIAAGTRIPLGLLGLGADGHTASLFRPEHLAAAQGRLAIAVQRPDGRLGISATPGLFARVEEILFVVAGGGKEEALGAFVRQDPRQTAWAAVQACPQVGLWVDPEAAAGLPA